MDAIELNKIMLERSKRILESQERTVKTNLSTLQFLNKINSETYKSSWSR